MASGFHNFLAGLVLLVWVSQVSSRYVATNGSTPIISSIVLPSPVHSDVPPPALTPSCTNYSITSPDTRLTSFEYQKSNDETLVNFTVFNRMIGSTIECQGVSLQSSVTGDCHLTGNFKLKMSTFKYDAMTRTLTVNQSWLCNNEPATK